MAEKNPVAYVPITETPQNPIQAPTKIDVPNYPDKGTAYAGFSKTLISGNNYKLNPQTPFDSNVATIYAAGNTTSTITLVEDTTADCYITTIVIYANMAAQTVCRLQDPANGRIYWRGLLTNTVRPTQFTLSAPLKTSYRAQFVMSTPAAGGEEVAINIYGWAEPN